MDTRLEKFHTLLPLLTDVLRDIHPERWQSLGLAPEARDRLLGCERSRRRLSRNIGWIHPQGGEQARNWSDWREWAESIKAPGGVWLGLDGAGLWRIGLRFGAGCFRREIAGLVLREDVVCLRGGVGEDAHSFALRQAPLLWRDDAGHLPCVPDDVDEPLVDRIRKTAGHALGCWLADFPAELAERVRLRLPPHSDPDSKEPESWPPERRRMWMDLFNRVFAISASIGAK